MTTDLEDFTNACIEALYFTDTGDIEQPPAAAEIDPETLLDLKADCRSFWRRYGCFVTNADNGGNDAKQAGHDFWLTRNGHGAGFWDGDWKAPYDEMLTKGSKHYGVFKTYLGDDGKIHA
jgi:hypothetical protein